MRLSFPAWDTVPYDRVSPNAELSRRRIATLAQLARLKTPKRPVMVLTTINAVAQRVPPRDAMHGALLKLTPACARHERHRAAGILGLCPRGNGGGAGRFCPARRLARCLSARRAPRRLDFFGDMLETIREFDPETQRTS